MASRPVGAVESVEPWESVDVGSAELFAAFGVLEEVRLNGLPIVGDLDDLEDGIGSSPDKVMIGTWWIPDSQRSIMNIYMMR